MSLKRDSFCARMTAYRSIMLGAEEIFSRLLRKIEGNQLIEMK